MKLEEIIRELKAEEERISGATVALRQGRANRAERRRRRISLAARQRISLAQERKWAAFQEKKQAKQAGDNPAN